MREEFQVHQLNEQGLATATKVAEAFSRLMDELDELSPPSPIPAVNRERALIATKLQEACFRAKRSVAMRFENQLHEVAPPQPATEVVVARVATRPQDIKEIAREANEDPSR